MSHFSEVRTQFKNRKMLIQALKNRGHEVVMGQHAEGVSVTGFFDEKQSAEFKIKTETRYEIGFRKTEERAYDVVGDWELLEHTGVSQTEFVNSLKREYSKEMICEVARENNYEIEMTENGETQEVEMVISKW